MSWEAAVVIEHESRLSAPASSGFHVVQPHDADTASQNPTSPLDTAAAGEEHSATRRREKRIDIGASMGAAVESRACLRSEG